MTNSYPEAPSWPAHYIIADLMILRDQNGVYIADGDYEWSRQAVLHVRMAFQRGETLNAFACKWCEPGDPFYEEFNRRWERLGRPVQS